MFGATVSGAYLAALAPAADRGTYMGISSLSWALAAALAPLTAGLLLEVLTPGPVLLLMALLPLGATLIYLRSGQRHAAIATDATLG